MDYCLMQQLTHNLKLELCSSLNTGLLYELYKRIPMGFKICQSVSNLIAVQWLNGCLYLTVQF